MYTAMTVAQQHRRKFVELQTDWYALILGLLLPFGLGIVVANDAKETLYAAWVCIGVGLVWTGLKVWRNLSWSRWVKGPLACLVVTGVALLAHVSINERLRPSFTLVTPGPIFNQDTWDFIINHRGAKTSFAAQILFVDNDKLDSLRGTQKEVSSADISSYQLLLQVPEVNPSGYGSIFAKQFQWKPFQLENGHFSIEITWRDGAVHEDVGIAKINNQWKDAISVVEKKTGKILYNCKDEGYPSAGSLPACFPAIAQVLD